MDYNIAVALLDLTDATAIGEAELAVSCETTEDSYDVFRCLVRLVYDNHPSETNCSEEG